MKYTIIMSFIIMKKDVIFFLLFYLSQLSNYNLYKTNKLYTKITNSQKKEFAIYTIPDI